jgi:hypothetical protein
VPTGLNLGPEARGQRLLERLGRGMTPTGVQKRERATEKLVHAGYRRPEDLRLFLRPQNPGWSGPAGS